jgi:hypothetical protein
MMKKDGEAIDRFAIFFHHVIAMDLLHSRDLNPTPFGGFLRV